MNQASFDIFYKSSGINTDTRSIEKDSLFICIKGDNFDGNTFALKALDHGAMHAIVDNPDFYVENGKMTLVSNSVEYLQQLANYHRLKFNIPVIGITGSNGKTTTKELIQAVLSKKYNVLATKGNLNNHLGVPFTLLRLRNDHEIAIIEMGANRLKDIEELCAIAEPTCGIITNIGKAHLEGFKNFEGVLNTKKELYDAVALKKGKIIVNTDDQVLIPVVPGGVDLLTYGTAPQANVMGTLISLSPFVEMKWSFGSYESATIRTQMVGKYNFYNYMAAIAFGVEFGVENSAISKAIEEYTPTNNRSQVKITKNNTLILDCYNANPTSMKSALESFAMNKQESKICILGDMKELGEESISEHKKIMALLEELHLKSYVVGDDFSSIDSSAILSKFPDAKSLSEYLLKNPVSNKLVLLKGSRSIGLEVLEEYL